MALPKLLQKLFTNGGAGDKLNQDIIPVLNTASRNLGETSMVSLGFATNSTVTLVQFFQKLAEHGYTDSNSVLKFSYNYGIGAYVTDGTNTVRIVGGTLYLGNNSHNTSNDYGVAWGLFVPPEGTKLYRFTTYKDPSQAESVTPRQNIYTYESGGFPVGFLALYSGSNVPDGWFRCDGSTIADMATNYPKLYAVLGTNVLPNYTGRFPMGAVSDINTAVESGLPDIQGSFVAGDSGYGAAEGAFTKGARVMLGGQTAYEESGSHRISFYASKYNAIYGASTTVQPPAVKVAVLIKHD